MEEKDIVQQLDSIEEFEDQPVPEEKTKSLKSFVQLVAGEHIAGTEFVIGPMFVAYGVSAKDLFLGLLIGNILAMLSWTFICARLAVKTRLTIFYHLERICGKKPALIYNVVNVLLFSFVTGSMIAVSATAVGIPFHIDMPGLEDMLPTGIGWIITVVIIGSVITVVAILGYDIVAKFSGYSVPWMPLVFIAGAVAVLPQLGVTSPGNFWQVANEKIWTGVPFEGMPKFTIWHVAAFAWLANTNMHIGLNDTAIYRYAKKWQYGFASAVGLFIGHYMAWVASGILCAAALGVVTPGVIAYNSMGIAGMLAVIIAGWTTANPTLYRAGLAMKIILPRYKRWQTTALVGLIIIAMAIFPGVVTKLMNFLAFYALVAAPVGAVIFMDVYLFPKIGLISNYAEYSKSSFNWAVAVTWLFSFVVCDVLHIYFGIEGFEFFLAVPGWIIGAVTYIVLSRIFQSKHLKVAGIK